MQIQSKIEENKTKASNDVTNSQIDPNLSNANDASAMSPMQSKKELNEESGHVLPK